LGFVSPTDLQINSFGARPGPILKYIELLMLWFVPNQSSDEAFNAIPHQSNFPLGIMGLVDPVSIFFPTFPP